MARKIKSNPSINRDLESEVTTLLQTEYKKYETTEECVAALAPIIRKDITMLNYLTHPRLESVLAERLHQIAAAERLIKRNENSDNLEMTAEESDTIQASPIARRLVREAREGRLRLTEEWLEQRFGGRKLKDWVVSELKLYIDDRRQKLQTESVQLDRLEAVIDYCRVASGSDDVKVGEVITSEIVDKIWAGEYVMPKRKSRGKAA